jgi:glycosyltransferase involved in cell wall biosynthesis
MMAKPVAASVIVLSYQSRDRIPMVLIALRKQDLNEPFEVIVVDSGDDGAADLVRSQFPEVRVVHSETRLRPGPARNRGVREAAGEFIAFLPDDGLPRMDWLRLRLQLHRGGFDIVGGAIISALPESYLARSEHLLEYSALLPVEGLLRAQDVPHCLSFHRRAFEQVGMYPEDTITGEDTLFNRRCVEAEMPVAFSAEIQMAHVGNTRLFELLRHGYGHGRGLMQCAHDHHLGSVIGNPNKVGQCAVRALLIYPALGLVAKARRLRRFAPELLGQLLLASPVIYLALLATGCGAFVEWMRISRRSSTR